MNQHHAFTDTRHHLHRPATGEQRVPRVYRHASATLRRHFALMIAAVLLFGAAQVQAERVYRFEESGRVIYQDRQPSSSQDAGHKVLNQQGVVLEEILSRQERRKARMREREEELALIRDRALLATFTTEEDLIRTRDDRVGMIDGLISRLDDRIRILSDRLDVVDQRIRIQEAASGVDQAQETLYAEQLSIQRNIENAWSLIDSKAADRHELAEKFAADLERYRELKSVRTR